MVSTCGELAVQNIINPTKKMKKTLQSVIGTCFHDGVFTATPTEVKAICGKPSMSQNNGRDKCNYEWDMETEDGTVFTVYDWKEYRRLGQDEPIEWHIGAFDTTGSQKALDEIKAALLAQRNHAPVAAAKAETIVEELLRTAKAALVCLDSYRDTKFWNMDTNDSEAFVALTNAIKKAEQTL